jgi:hypothetical protein
MLDHWTGVGIWINRTYYFLHYKVTSTMRDYVVWIKYSSQLRNDRLIRTLCYENAMFIGHERQHVAAPKDQLWSE